MAPSTEAICVLSLFNQCHMFAGLVAVTHVGGPMRAHVGQDDLQVGQDVLSGNVQLWGVGGKKREKWA